MTPAWVRRLQAKPLRQPYTLRHLYHGHDAGFTWRDGKRLGDDIAEARGPRWESDDCDDSIHERHWADVVTLSWAFCAEDDEPWPCAAILAHETAFGYLPPSRTTRPG
jgi:hypothetical protein